MIVLFTDFGSCGPYVGQMRAVLVQKAPSVPVIELFNDAPSYNPQASAYLLAAYVEEFPAGTVFLCVVDPGVGSSRKPLMVQVDGRWFVGPDNGLFDVVAQRAQSVSWREITWRPQHLSASFHGRDLFAPAAAELAKGNLPASQPLAQRISFTGPQDLAQILYLDSFGNAMTGLRAAQLPLSARLQVHSHVVQRVRTFSDVASGDLFWYENANGLAELAVNKGHAGRQFGLSPGDTVTMLDGADT